jgi:hypothetical protein
LLQPRLLAGQGVVGVSIEPPNRILLTTQSESGTWFCVVDDAYSGITFGQAATRSEVDTFEGCHAPAWK